jgi:TolB-like protein/Flp pilus assembly protein TadD
MEAADTRRGFKLGDWVIRPDAALATTAGRSRTLTPDQVAVLLLLAARPDDAVPQSELRDTAFPGDGDGDARLQSTLRQLRELLGGSSDDRHYIVHVGHDAWALVADLAPLPAAGGEGPEPRRTVGGRLQHFLSELRRRSVFKVGGAYLVGMWIMLQVAEVTFEPLHFPQWWMTALTILAVLGLPIVIALAWSYEITPGGIVLDTGDGSSLPMPRARRAIAPAVVAGVTLMACVTGYAWWRSIDTASRPAPPDPGDASIAVLPLVDMSPAGGIAYLGDGLSEELSAALAQIPGLRVAARTSAFEFKGKAVDVRRIGESLGVRHVLEGSVRRDGDRLRVTVQLIDAATGYHVWARSYDRNWSDVIAIQDDIARSVTEALKVVLASDESLPKPPAPVETPDVRALDPYLAGLALMRKSGDLSVMKEAENRFSESIGLAPEFARAYAGLCRVRVRMYQRTRDDAYVALAETACRRALELDPGQLETEKGLADLYLASGRNAESEAICRQLVARYPSDADGHLCLGAAQSAAGHLPEAERSLRAAVQAEPSYWVTHSRLGAFLFEQGRADEAIAEFREVTRLTPSSSSAYSNLGAALQFKGDNPGAEAAYRRSIAIEPSASALSNLGTLNYFAGRYEQAVEDYRRATTIAARDQEIWGNLGDAYWQLGQRDQALAAYRRAVELGTRDLEKQPKDPGTLSRLGYYHGRLGDTARADDYLDRAEAVAQDNPYSAYYRAVAAADRGDAENARALASRAAQLGYPEDALKADPALKKVLTSNWGGKSR